MIINTLSASWPVPEHVRTLFTQLNTKFEGDAGTESTLGFNLSSKSGEAESEVFNRRLLLERHLADHIEGFETLGWLRQVHGTRVIRLEKNQIQNECEADASFSFDTACVCVVTTADCLPVFLSDKPGNFVAVVHAGWQGLYKNILSVTIDAVDTYAAEVGINLGELCAYIGPAISQKNYQVDQAFYKNFLSLDKQYKTCFVPDSDAHYRADLPAIARIQLETLGVNTIIESGICSYEHPDFYSYRRASQYGENTGRFASMIWLEPKP